MRRLESTALRVRGSRLWILDQTALPDRETWIDASQPEAMARHIRDLRVRGAPLIGVAAALCLACCAEAGASAERLLAASDVLRSSRPTAVNLRNALARQETYVRAIPID